MEPVIMFTDLAIGIAILAIVVFVGKITILNKSYELKEQKDKYIVTYDLYKLEEDFRKRGLSYKQLDEYAKQFETKKTTLQQIDEEYEKKETKQNQSPLERVKR